ncbi:hypothetical protein D3C85_1076110 [compost metagenome]
MPDLMVIQSSPTLMWQSEMCTFLHDSGLMPSVLGECGLLMVTAWTLTFSQNSGLTVQNGELRMVMPSINTFLQNMGCINGGRKKPRFICLGSSGSIMSLLRLAKVVCHFDIG